VRDGLAGGETAGNFAAVLSAFGFAAFTLTLRWGKLEDMMPAVVLGGLFSMAVAVIGGLITSTILSLVVIPPVAARFWTDRVGTMVVLSGLIGLAAAAVGVAASAARPGLATGPLVVIAAAGAFAVSFLCAPHRGWIARRAEAARGLTVRRGDDEGEAGR
jgi:hypothetical protein